MRGARAASGRDRDHRPGHRLDGVFPAGVETINLEPDAGQLAGWLRTRYPDEIDTLRVTTAHDTYARTAAWVADALGLPGPDARHVAHAVSKSNQKALLAAHGIPAAQFVTGTLAAPAALAAAADPLRSRSSSSRRKARRATAYGAARTSPRSVRSSTPSSPGKPTRKRSRPSAS